MMNTGVSLLPLHAGHSGAVAGAEMTESDGGGRPNSNNIHGVYPNSAVRGWARQP